MKRAKLYLLIFAVFSICSITKLSAQSIVLKNNLLYDATATPNLGLEVRVAPKWTVGLMAGYNPFPLHDSERKWKHVLISPEFRYWCCSAFAGHFVGANLIYSHYNAGGIHLPFGLVKSLRTERFQGDLAGIGAFYGYSWILSNRWSVEADIGIGYGYTHYKRYSCIKCGSFKGTDVKHHLILSKIGLSVVYNLK